MTGCQVGFGNIPNPPLALGISLRAHMGNRVKIALYLI